jgi:hypothetical protein
LWILSFFAFIYADQPRLIDFSRTERLKALLDLSRIFKHGFDHAFSGFFRIDNGGAVL